MQAETEHLTETTAAHGAPHQSGGLPQMNPEWFASQIFWLVIAFGFLYFVLGRVAIPRIAGVIEERRDRIADDLDRAEQFRKESEGALKAYEVALAEARGRALALADENRRTVASELDRAKADADAQSQKTMAEAEARIAATREKAKTGIRAAAAEAAADVVARLIGETVGADEAARAVEVG